VLAGLPNVGKSSLLNALAGSDVAIVTAIAGTTRDKITETIHVEGIPINVIDTAGIRDDDDASDEVERIGISRTWAAVAGADVVLHILDASRGPTRADEDIAARLPAKLPLLRIWNKIDLSGHPPAIASAGDVTNLYLSASAGSGMDLLRKELLSIAGWQQTGESIYLARERHLQALQAARDHLAVAAQLAGQRDSALDLFAEELRLAQEQLNSITGAFTSDDLLGVIFSRFCIGK
jgi:tRNA modification GTPase